MPKSKHHNKLILVEPCHFWGKYKINNVNFSLETAHKLLVDLQSKKSDHSVKSKLKVYDNGLKLKKRAHILSDKMTFQQIQRYFVFKNEPHLIILGVEKKPAKRFYYTILLQDMVKVNEICDLIEQKRGGFVDQVQICPMPPVEVCPLPPHVDKVNCQTQSEPVEEKIVYIEEKKNYSENKSEHVPVVKSNIEYHYDERHTDDMGTTTVDALLVRTNRKVSSVEWNEDMKYLEYNPQLGTISETEAGPIYMYTAHFTPAEYKIYGSCESDSSDGSWDTRSHDSSSHDNTTGMVMRHSDGRTVVMAHRGSDAGFR